MGLEPVYEIVPLRMLREHISGMIARLFYLLINHRDNVRFQCIAPPE
jgi:hypothetical protein